MRKILLGVLMCFVALLAACSTISENTTASEETKNAIINGDYEAALHYGELAIKEGYEDKEFGVLVNNLKYYIEAANALEENDLETAKNAFSEIEDFSGSGMAMAIEDLEEDILELEEESEEFDEVIKDIEDDVKDGYYSSALSDAEELLEDEEDDLTLAQKDKIQGLIAEAKDGKEKTPKPTKTQTSTPAPTPKSTPTPTPTPTQAPPRVTEQEALTVVAEKFGIHDANGDITISDQGNYFQVNVTEYIPSGDEIIEDETSCKVDKTTGEIYDLAG